MCWSIKLIFPVTLAWTNAFELSSFLLWYKNWNWQQYMYMKNLFYIYHYNGVIKGAIASQITSLAIVYSTVYSGADQRKHQSSASLAFVRIFFSFDDVIMLRYDITITQWANGILLGVYLDIQSIHHVLVYKTHIPHYPGMDQRIWFKQFFLLWCKNLNRQQYMHMKNLFYIYHCNGVIKGAIASQITSLTIVYSSVYSVADKKKNIKFPRHWPLCREFTGDRWIPRINGQLRGKCFHLMTSSWCLNNGVSPHVQ